MGIGSPPVSAHDKHLGRVYTLRCGIKETQSGVWMSRAGFFKARCGVESGCVVVLFALHTGIILQRINGSLVTIDCRFDTTTVEAEGVPP